MNKNKNAYIAIVTIRKITDVITVGKNNTAKRNLIGETCDESYPQMLDFEFFGKNCDLLKDFQEGDTAEIKFDIRGREWRDPKTGSVRIFMSLSAWAIEDIAAQHPVPGSTATPEVNSTSTAAKTGVAVDVLSEEDIPF